MFWQRRAVESMEVGRAHTCPARHDLDAVLGREKAPDWDAGLGGIRGRWCGKQVGTIRQTRQFWHRQKGRERTRAAHEGQISWREAVGRRMARGGWGAGKKGGSGRMSGDAPYGMRRRSRLEAGGRRQHTPPACVNG